MNFKKLIALVLAAVMMMSLASVASAAASMVDTPAGKITITGLQEGDVVSLYRVIGWYADPGTNSYNWQVVSPFTGVSEDVKGYYVDMTAAKASALATALENNPVAAVTTGDDGKAGTGGKYTTTNNLPVGMYLAIVQTQSDEGTGTWVYNPMILSVNFNKDDPSEAVGPEMAATSEFDAGTATAVAKKQPVTLDKENKTSDDAFTATTGTTGENALTIAEGVAIGSVLPYTVNVTVPSYTAAFVHPKFIVTDTLSDGLTLDQNNISVKAGTTDLEKGENKDYTITTGEHGYTINFTETYLHRAGGGTLVTIEYKATVTTAAIFNVNRENNTVTLKYSNNANSEGDFDTTSDETNHYTFSLDATINGTTSGHSVTSELIKTGHDGNGDPLYKWNVESGEVWTSETKLEGAVFTLSGKLNGVNWQSEYTSGPNGEINIKGLDEGTYTLQEKTAPTGYIKDPNPHTIVITGTYEDKTNDNGKTFKILKSYTVTVDGNETKYTVTNEGQHVVKTSEIETGTTTAIVNTKGLELPSTGGIGTTLFYAIGGLMVLAAGIVLVTRRKADEE